MIWWPIFPDDELLPERRRPPVWILLLRGVFWGVVVVTALKAGSWL
jgi:hypothetical protein